MGTNGSSSHKPACRQSLRATVSSSRVAAHLTRTWLVPTSAQQRPTTEASECCSHILVMCRDAPSRTQLEGR
ncbi:hypothetical protein E2C01_034432 [Portunus trituberculatus]|uniref:Uncharacterized protein n=1 Tax=Portunus trituberculatus TaxID=210409 RepID=A0A5B7F6N0_PORTR|nr:hypothetical protein [Portunus trituberculatus]